MKIGIYGGTFDPPHLGHMRAAQAAISLLGLDQLILIPAKLPPHKKLSLASASPSHRLAMTRLMGIMPTEFSRISLGAIPTVLAGVLFGPVAGGLVGFVSDLVGCLFTGYGYNPLFCVPPILYGVCGGLFRGILAQKVTFLRVLLAIAPAAILGSILYQSWALGFVSGKGFWFYLSTRSIQHTITAVVGAVVINLLFRTKLFQRMGVWPPKKAE